MHTLVTLEDFEKLVPIDNKTRLRNDIGAGAGSRRVLCSHPNESNRAFYRYAYVEDGTKGKEGGDDGGGWEGGGVGGWEGEGRGATMQYTVLAIHRV